MKAKTTPKGKPSGKTAEKPTIISKARGEGGISPSRTSETDTDSFPKNISQCHEPDFDWTCPTCGRVCRWIQNADRSSKAPEGLLTISPYHHHVPKTETLCAYGGGWWQWRDDGGWQEIQAAPVMRLVADRIEFERAPEPGKTDGRYLGSLPGHDPDKWMLHLIRASDPAYPTLMDEEMKWLGEVRSAEEELYHQDARYLIGRYTWALSQMERQLVKLFQKTTLQGIRVPIASTIRRLYDHIRHHAIEAKGPPSPTADGGVPFARYATYHSEEAIATTQSEAKAKLLAAKVLRTGRRKRPANEECARWTTSQMYRVWEIIMSSADKNRKSELTADVQRLSEAIGEQRLRWEGFSFPELWMKWLECYLRDQWEFSRPLIAGRTHKFEFQKPSIAYAAALFWCHNLSHFEPERRAYEDKVLTSLMNMKKRKRSISGK